MSGEDILISIILGLTVNELCDVSPWCAHRLVRLSARLRYANLERRRVRAAELVALVDERPGKLFKLGTALGFLSASVPAWVRRAAPNAVRRLVRPWSTRGAAPWSPESTRMTLTNLSSLPAAALEIGAALSAPGSVGGLVTVSGTWGSGKTTFVRAALAALDGVPAITYNPWTWPQGHRAGHALDGLVEEIRAASSDLAPLATALEKYIGSLSPRAGRTRSHTLGERRARRRLARSFRALSQPLVIVLDDIDRLHPDQMRQVFDVIARTTRLPHLGYLMSFDRSLVESLLPPGLLDRCIGKLQVELAWGTCRRRLS